MMTSSGSFKSRMNRRNQVELEEARRAGLFAVKVDEVGNEINPQYMSSASWHLKSERPSLKHQRKQKSRTINTDSWYDRIAKTLQADKFRKGACENCGAMTHNSK